jgi:hypothetical protein
VGGGGEGARGDFKRRTRKGLLGARDGPIEQSTGGPMRKLGPVLDGGPGPLL